MKFCSNCGNKFNETDKFCSNCGTPKIVNDCNSTIVNSNFNQSPNISPINSFPESLSQKVYQSPIDEIILEVSILIDGNLKYGYINLQGNWIIQPAFDYPLLGFEDKDYCAASLNDNWGYINRQGNWIIQPSFDGLDGFDDKDYCAASVNGKYGYINRQGNWIIQPNFNSLSRFDDKDYCKASVNEKYGYINRQGNWIIQPTFDFLYDFNETDITCFGVLDDSGYLGYGLLNRRNEILVGSIFVEPFNIFNNLNQNKFIVRMDILKYGIISNDGRWLLQPIYWLLESTIYPNIFKAALNNKFGFINDLGEWIIPPFYDYEIIDFEGDKMIWDENNQLWNYNRFKGDDDENDEYDQTNYIDNDPLGLRS